MRTSIFEGWTLEQQCFDLMEDGKGRYCAIGWLSHKRVSHEEFVRIYRDVGNALVERFPELQFSISPIVDANDHLHLDPEVFLSLDRESIAREEEATVEEVQ